MSRQIKEGYVQWYKKRWFGKDWREVYMVLHEDSTLMWYSEKEDSSPLGGIILKDSPEMIAVGQFTAQIPDRPEFPQGTDIRSCMAFGSRSKPTVQWFVFRNEPSMVEWLKSMGTTLPPPPQPPDQQQTDGTSQPAQPYLPQQGGAPPAPSAPPQGQYRGPPPAYSQNQGYQQRPQGYPQQGGGQGQNTVIIRDRDNGGDFASGMMLGTGLGLLAG